MKKEEFYIARGIKYVEKVHTAKEVARDIKLFNKERKVKERDVQS